MKRQQAGVVEFILGALVLPLPAGDPGGVSLEDSVSNRLFHYTHQYGDAVLDRRFAALVSDPAVYCTIDSTVGDHSNG